jgi:hypothetical protein
VCLIVIPVTTITFLTPASQSIPFSLLLLMCLHSHYHRSSRSCNTLAIDSLAKDCNFSACGRQPIVPFNFYCHFIFLIAINHLMFVSVKKKILLLVFDRYFGIQV